MRVKVIGNTAVAKTLRGHLGAHSNVVVVDTLPDFTVKLHESGTTFPVVDGVDGDLERHVVNQLGEMLGTVTVARRDGNRRDDTIVVGIPAGQEAQAARALFRALTGGMAKVRRSWWRRRLLVALLALLPGVAQAQNVVLVKCHDGTTAFFCGDAANQALRVNVVAGGSGGGTVDQGAGAGAATNFWNFRLTDGTSFYSGLTDTELRATPVPVSGTFWQATQPISAAALPLPSGAATAALQTQPGVDIGDVTINNAAGASAVNVQDGGNTLTVDGTVTANVPAGLDVDVLTLPALVAGSANIGDVDVLTLPNVTIGTFPDNEPVAQGTAAATTAGWPVMNGTVALSTVSWTSATAVDTALTYTIGGAAYVSCTAIVTGSITVGTVNIEVSNDAGTSWVLTAGAMIYSLNAIGPTSASSIALPLVGANGAVMERPVAGYDRIRLRLNPAITGAGTAAIKCMGGTFASSLMTNISQLIPGNAATALGKAEDAAANTGDTGVAMLVKRNESTTALTSATDEYTHVSADAYGVLYARRDHPTRIRCTQTISTATTLTVMPGAAGVGCAAPGAGLSIYITDILFATNAGAIAADTFNTLKYGTGGACGTGTTVFWGAMTTAATQATVVQSFATPIKIPANNEVCWINSTAGSKFVVITGFVAP